MKVSLKPLTIEDAPLIFEWRNDPFILNLGSSQKIVEWDEHINWVINTIGSNLKKAYIIFIDDIPAGQVRFDREQELSTHCVISVYLIEKFTGKGIGIEAIKKGCEIIKEVWGRDLIIQAFVMMHNVNSHKAFIKAGFVYFGRDSKHNIYEFR